MSARAPARPPRLGAALLRAAAAGAPALVGSVALAAAGTLAPAPLEAQGRAGPVECAACHAEPELLRQQAGSAERARALLVPPASLRASAHGDLACGDCHGGFSRFPHGEGRTEGCASCHSAADSAWAGSAHEGTDPASTATCQECHGIHDVRPASRISRAPGPMNGRCVECHGTAVLPASDPHAGEVPCHGCHAPHATRRVDHPGALVARVRQVETCGTCHDSVAGLWRDDAHGRALLAEPTGGERGGPEAPTCTGCHGAHGMVSAAEGAAADTLMVDRCGSCHAYYERTYFGTYHGKATAVGSRVVATCHDCHSAHGILPPSDSGSTVSAERLPETCGACHGHVRPSFTAYESHPDPTDRAKNPVLFYSFWFMNALLVGVLGVFGLHTLLWWVRLEIDRRRGVPHEIGGHGE